MLRFAAYRFFCSIMLSDLIVLDNEITEGRKIIMDTKAFSDIAAFLPKRLGNAALGLSENIRAGASEIRLRVGQPMSVTVMDRQVIVSKWGGEASSANMGIIPTSEELSAVFETACRSSVHCFRREISMGFVTVKGGHRIGFCGTAVRGDDNSVSVSHISGINCRIARQISGAADELAIHIPQKGGLLLAGAPCSGKTTYLRDLCRILGNKSKVSLIDDTGEIAAVYRGEAQNRVGMFTDILSGYGKADGLMTAVRVMSPQYIICDEIGGEDECRSIEMSANSGVKFIAAVHAADKSELLLRPQIKKLIKKGIFTRAAFLEKCTIKSITDITERDLK